MFSFLSDSKCLVTFGFFKNITFKEKNFWSDIFGQLEQKLGYF